MLQNKKLAYLGNYPSLTILKHCYGDTAATNWLTCQIEDLNAFYGSSQPMDVTQITMIAELIASEPRYLRLKISEWILFFTMFKLGYFDEVYGALKPSDITKALHKFSVIRYTEIDRIEAEERAKQEIAMRDVNLLDIYNARHKE